MTIVNIHAAKNQFSRLVERAAAGEEIIIARAGTPLARLGPLAPARRRRSGLLKGRIRIRGNFDTALPDRVLKSFAQRQIPLL